MKKIETNVVKGKDNGGLDSLRAYKRAVAVIDKCSIEYAKAEMYHLCFVERDAQTVEALMQKTQKQLRRMYSKAIHEIARRLRRYGIRCRWLGAYEYEEQNIEGTSKLFHFHVMIICDATNYPPSSILNRNSSCWLSKLLEKLGVHMYINPPRGYMHLPKIWKRMVDDGRVRLEDIPDRELKLYQSLPRTKPGKIQDAKERISYLYKRRGKAGVEGDAYTSSRDCKGRVAKQAKPLKTDFESKERVQQVGSCSLFTNDLQRFNNASMIASYALVLGDCHAGSKII